VLPSESTTPKGADVLASSYPFLDVFWTMMVFFLWILWLWILFTVFADIFRRDDLSGWGKAGWIIFTIVLPYLGVFIYLITQSKGMTERNLERANAQRAQFDDYVRSTAGSGGGAAAEIDRAKALLDSGAIDQAEFEAIKRKALA
jgi:Short C-terminal domain